MEAMSCNRCTMPMPERLKRVRKDLSEWLFHFCARRGEPLETLKLILKGKYVKGSTDKYCKQKCVCLTEIPLPECARQLNVFDEERYGRFSPFGLAFRKNWIFDRGGLPVIYQPRRFREKLPEDMRWRHCDFDLARNLDFTWQREWRVTCDSLPFEREDVIVVVPTNENAMEHLCSNHEIDFERNDYFYDQDWEYVTLEGLANARSPRDVEMFSPADAPDPKSMPF